MENLEMVMEKSWENILSSLWEPCPGVQCVFFSAVAYTQCSGHSQEYTFDLRNWLSQ